jgi:hypothetical protein
MEQAPTPTEAPAPVETAAAPEQAPVTDSTPAPIGDLLQTSTEPITPETSFLDSFSEEYRDDPNIAKHKSLDSMAKSLISAQQMLGKKGIIKPGEDATPEEMSDFYNQIGRPAEADMYKYEPIEGAPEVGQEELSAYQQFAHDKGFTQEQYQAGIEFQYQQQQAATQALEQERMEEASQTQRNIFDEMGELEGKAFIKDASKAAEALGLLEIMTESGMANNEAVIRAFAEANKHLGSSSIVGDHGSGVLDFDGQVEALRSRPGYKDRTHPDYASIQAEMDELFRKRYPND